MGSVRRWWPHALFAVSLTAFVVFFLLSKPYAIDLRVYRDEGLQVLHRADIYGHLPDFAHLKATYPPFAAVLFGAVALLPVRVAIDLVVAANLVLVVVVGYLAGRLIGVRSDESTRFTLVLAAVTLWAEPVLRCLQLGQIDLALLALVLFDFSRDSTRWWRGIALGLAAAIKVTPLLLIVYLVLTRRWRMAITSTATFVATILLSAAFVPRATKRYWTSLLFQVRRVGFVENSLNQSVRGLFARLAHSPSASTTTTSVVVLVGAAGLVVSVVAYHLLDEAWGLIAAAVTGLLVSPIAWSHHWVWVVPMAALLWRRARVWTLLAVPFWTYVIRLVPQRESLHLDLVQQIVSGVYVYFGIAFLVLTAVKSVRTRQRSP